MFKPILLSMTVYCFVSASPVWASLSCHGLFNPTSEKQVSFSSDPSIDAQIKSIQSVESLADLLSKVGEIDPANRSTVLKMAQFIYQDGGQTNAQNLVRDLLMNHRYIAKSAVLNAWSTVARNEASSANGIKDRFPKPIPEKNFLKWMQLGKEMDFHVTFLKAINEAVKDMKSFSSRNSLDPQQALIDVMHSLKKLDDPSLVGQFMDTFLTADRLTKQYILDMMVELKYTNSENARTTLALKGTSSGEPNEIIKSIEKLLNQPLDTLQEDAYFSYTSAGHSNRPVLQPNEITKSAALRFLKRMEHSLSFGSKQRDVRYAVEMLTQYPKADPKIDSALLKVLSSGNLLPQGHDRHFGFYAQHELLILERNARGLSSLKIDLRYNVDILSAPTGSFLYLRTLLKFHAEFDLRNYPSLMNMAIAYFKANPVSLVELNSRQDENVNKFKSDFGF